MQRQKNLFLLIFVVIITAGLISQVAAMGEKAPAKKAVSTKSTTEIFQATGRVIGNEPRNSTLAIAINKGRPLTLVIDKNSIISKGRKNIAMAGISYGDSVEITYEVKKGQNIAKSIIVQEKSSFTSPKKSR